MTRVAAIDLGTNATRLLVADVTEEVQKAFKVTITYVGGHSQGAFLTYSVILNYPDLFRGAFFRKYLEQEVHTALRADGCRFPENLRTEVSVATGLPRSGEPWLTVEAVSHSTDDAPPAGRLTVRHFGGGHMFYAWEESRRAFTEAISAFVTDALPQ